LQKSVPPERAYEPRIGRGFSRRFPAAPETGVRKQRAAYPAMAIKTMDRPPAWYPMPTLHNRVAIYHEPRNILILLGLR
jgi:hypothetical protein